MWRKDYNIFHRRNFSCERKNISCHRKFISCHRSGKEHLVSQDIFPVKEKIFLVTGNEFAVTGRIKNTSSLVNWSHEFLTSHWFRLCVNIVSGWRRNFSPLFLAKLFTWKLGSHEISNFIPPCQICAHLMRDVLLGLGSCMVQFNKNITCGE